VTALGNSHMMSAGQSARAFELPAGVIRTVTEAPRVSASSSFRAIVRSSPHTVTRTSAAGQQKNRALVGGTDTDSVIIRPDPQDLQRRQCKMHGLHARTENSSAEPPVRAVLCILINALAQKMRHFPRWLSSSCTGCEDSSHLAPGDLRLRCSSPGSCQLLIATHSCGSRDAEE